MRLTVDAICQTTSNWTEMDCFVPFLVLQIKNDKRRDGTKDLTSLNLHELDGTQPSVRELKKLHL